MISLPKLAIYLHLIVLVQSRVLIAPDDSGYANEVQAIDRAMEDLLKKHKDFIERHVGPVELTKFQAKSHSTKERQFKKSRKQSQSSLKDHLQLHMTPITAKDVSCLEQKLRHKFPDFRMDVPDLQDSREMKSLLLFYSNE